VTIAIIIAAAAAFLMTAAIAAAVFNLHTSDPAGNGLAVVYTLAGLAILWSILTILQILASFRPAPEYTSLALRFATIALFLFAAASQLATLIGLSGRDTHPLLVALLRITVIASPLLLIALALLRSFPSLRELTPSSAVPWSILAIVAALCLIPCLHALSTTWQRKVETIAP
jgi:hypothetical protein